MKKFSILIAAILLIIGGCVPATLSPSPTTVITLTQILTSTPATLSPSPTTVITLTQILTSTPVLTPQQDEWRVLKSIATEDNLIQQDNPTEGWDQKILAESINFSSELQIKLNMESKGANGIILTANMPGDTIPDEPWWKGHKRLEIFYEFGSLGVNLRDGSQEQPIYTNNFPIFSSTNAVTNGEVVVTFDKQAKNIRIQYGHQIVLQLNVAIVGDFPSGLFPNNQILDVWLSSGPDSSVKLSELEFLVPNTDHFAIAPTVTPIIGLPDAVVPEGFGVSIHFLVGHPLELDSIEQAGFQFVRTDARWDQIEQSKGVYDFSNTDILVEEASQRNMRVMFLLSSGNPLYDNGLAPHTDDGRAGFVRFAAALATRYVGKGIIWDLWGEPNLFGWKPRPNVQDYAKLISETIPAIRKADPSAVILGPGGILEQSNSWDFYDELGKLGVLSEFDAVSIHPYYYPVLKPEDVQTVYSHLRQILDKYNTERKIPIVVDEYGYSTTWPGISESRQAEYLVRHWLINLSNNVNLSTWYDWKDDGSDKNNSEDNFGIVNIIGQPKPAYLAAQTFMQILKGYHFERRISISNNNDFFCVFSKGSESILVAWTVYANHKISLPLVDSITGISMLGEKSTITPGVNGLTIELSNSPQYLLLGTQTIQ